MEWRGLTVTKFILIIQESLIYLDHVPSWNQGWEKLPESRPRVKYARICYSGVFAKDEFFYFITVFGIGDPLQQR